VEVKEPGHLVLYVRNLDRSATFTGTCWAGGRSRVGLYHFGLKVGDSDDELREALAAPIRPLVL
jgi:hypothetical protein